MERLTKKELRALLECIKECYPICDLENFAQRVVSRLSKVVPTEIISITGSTRAAGGMFVRLIRMPLTSLLKIESLSRTCASIQLSFTTERRATLHKSTWG